MLSSSVYQCPCYIRTQLIASCRYIVGITTVEPLSIPYMIKSEHLLNSTLVMTQKTAKTSGDVAICTIILYMVR